MIRLLTHIQYEKPNLDDVIYLGEDLVCSDVHQGSALIEWLDLELVEREVVEDDNLGKRTISTYKNPKDFKNESP